MKTFKIWTEGGKELNRFDSYDLAMQWIGINHYEILGIEKTTLGNIIFIVGEKIS